MKAMVLQKDAEKAKILKDFIKHCEKMQKEALKQRDPLAFGIWIKESRLARRELAALYRAKEQYDREQQSIRFIVRHLQKQGIRADVITRVHYIT
ncbi:hypothetical protein ACFQZ1_07900 [Bacillus sp. CGMCC 1.60114]|uniref:hypothetical protein n=1 Tax=unclassified Bacillus (in: firmicutes) TaxID=185979 RepID=UPI00362E5049